MAEKIAFLDLKKQYLSIKDEIDAAIQAVLDETTFIGGKFVQTFEKSFADYQHSLFCIGVGNGTDALEIALEALALPPHSEIIVPANSFIATSEAVTRTGHRVVFCDCGEDYLLHPETVLTKITPHTRAIILVHLYGQPCDLTAFQKLAQTYHLKLIEDCAQAHGALYAGQPVGTTGHLSTFSFYPGKNLGAYGDGGAILTQDPALAERCRMLANHGRLEKYNHQFEGRNSRLDSLQSSILTVKLKHLEKWIQRRNEIAYYYQKALQPLVEKGLIGLPSVPPTQRHAYHLFVIRTTKRDALQAYLKQHHIETGIHYPIALPDLAAYNYLSFKLHEFPNARRFAQEILSLPMGEHLTEAAAKTVIQTIFQFFAERTS